MTAPVILYDLPSKQKTGWSLNPWKTRMILNYKGIDYKTEWVEYPDLAPVLKSLGLSPHGKEAINVSADYTSPAIRYAGGTYAMDSWPIAFELEKKYPNPSLHLDNPIIVQVRDHIMTMREPLEPHLIPKVPTILPQRSADYFNETRAKKFGAPLHEIERDRANEECWEKAKAPAKETGDLLRKNGGLFFLGETVSYADFIFVAYLQWIRCMNEDIFQRYLTLDPEFPKIYEACGKWLERKD